jgi:hypothetical protein
LFKIRYRVATNSSIYSTIEWGSREKEQDIGRDGQLYVAGYYLQSYGLKLSTVNIKLMIYFLINHSRESLHMSLGVGRNQKSVTSEFSISVHGLGSLLIRGKIWNLRVRSVFFLDI